MLTFRHDGPRWGSNHIVKNGIIHNKKPKYKCQNCGRQFVANPNNKSIDKHRLDYIKIMLVEKLPEQDLLG
jgi:transposase-like protein